VRESSKRMSLLLEYDRDEYETFKLQSANMRRVSRAAKHHSA